MTHPTTPKRRVLYIRHRRRVDISDAFRMNQDEWVEAMGLVADVTSISDDFDMDEVCDHVQPDFILYESPPIHAAPMNIANPTAHSSIPRIGFQMQDPHCSTRVAFLRRMDELNIPWLFTHMTEAALRQSPELKARMFSVSQLFDDTVFYDYGLTKDFPVSVFGGFLAPEIYTWRDRTAREIAEHFPTLIYTHPGYLKPTPRHAFAVVGTDYARVLNRSHFSLADTTRLDCLVRKHLEIPASGSVLVAPDAPSLKPYGFRDMENCILGDGDALFDKIAAVADDPDFYERIRKSGYDLVHSRYSRKHWRGILDFYECLRTLKPGETVRQDGVLGPFKAVPVSDPPLPAIEAYYPESGVSAQMRSWLDRILGDGSLDDINDEILKIPDWLFHMTEEWVLLGLIALLKSDLAHATEFFLAGQSVRKKLTGFTDYDPEEIAWLSLTAALSGNAGLLALTQRESISMRHINIRRVQWLGEILATGGKTSTPPTDIVLRKQDDQISIHWTGQLNMGGWLHLISRILTANGQSGLLRI